MTDEGECAIVFYTRSMVFKLGELLLKKKMITEAQLMDALEAQVVYGGRLGTNLVELGFIDEDTLASVISRQVHIPFVKPERLRNIPSHVLNILPRDIIEKHRVLPLGADAGVIRLGMSPPDPAVLEEISRVTGLSVLPFVVTEIRLTEALERYYGIPRDPRLATTTRRLDSRREDKDRGPAFAITPSHTLRSVRKDLEKAGNRDDVADISLDTSLLFVKRAALFLHKGSYIQGWTGRGLDLTPDSVRRVEIPANVPSIFRTVNQDGKTLSGPVPDEPFTVRALTLMGHAVPRTFTLSPVPIRGRILTFLYGDHGEEGVVSDQEKDFIESLAREAGRTFDRLIFSARL